MSDGWGQNPQAVISREMLKLAHPVSRITLTELTFISKYALRVKMLEEHLHQRDLLDFLNQLLENLIKIWIRSTICLKISWSNQFFVHYI